VYFGYPQAHEDDAERAVRAGLELIAAVCALKATSPLQTRVGIATRLVVVGDLVGAGEAQERGIVGETPNLAASWVLRKRFHRELRIEAARLRQSEFRLGIVPPRGLSSRQKRRRENRSGTLRQLLV
jgi:hypothetical protein